MSEKNTCCEEECSSHEKCGNKCGHGFACHKSFYLVRWIFGIIILLMVFSVGICIGRFVGEVENYGNYHKFGRSHTRMMEFGTYGYEPAMTKGWILQYPEKANYSDIKLDK